MRGWDNNPSLRWVPSIVWGRDFDPVTIFSSISMIQTLRNILIATCILGAFSCAKLPEPVELELQKEVTVPRFVGGPNDADTAKLKQALVQEYAALAKAEEDLHQERMRRLTIEAGSTFGGFFGRSTHPFQTRFLKEWIIEVERRRKEVNVLRAELKRRGVTVIAPEPKTSAQVTRPGF